MLLNQTALALIGLLLAAWSIAAGWAILAARARTRRSDATQALARRLGAMIEESPALPLLVFPDGRIEGSARLAGWLGLPAVPGYLSELDSGTAGLTEADLGALADAVQRTQKTAGAFVLTVTPRGSQRSLEVRGALGDPRRATPTTVMCWVIDVSDTFAELVRSRATAAEAQARYGGLVGLLEAAPLPMWYRGPDLRLLLVNSAYVGSVGGDSAEAVIAAQCELVEPVGGTSAGQVAGQAMMRQQPVHRTVTATVGGERRCLRVSDLPLERGVAGYAIDIQDLDQQTRAFAAFREAQRQVLDTLSAAIAQFDAGGRLRFANRPFLHLFAIEPELVGEALPFERVLDRMRDNGRLPDVRDFPQWRRDHQAWFTADEVSEEAWLLADGTHLRVVAQPMPDGGLLLIFEDRTEQLQLAATRDILLRTRTATFDNLFEALAVFSPDGRLQLWNRRFAASWSLPEGFLDGHPHVDQLLERIAPRLKRAQQVNIIGALIRAATLERTGRGGLLALADGRYLEFAGVPLPDGNGLLTVLDITDSQNAEAALKERNAALVEADTAKNRFIANIAYEFRTPLTSISGFAELMQGGFAGELSPQARDYLAAILAASARLGEQIENVLDLAQSEAGTLPLASAPIDLRALAAEVLDQRREAVGPLAVVLDLRAGEADVRIEGDERRLARALGHLVDNAVAASPAGGTVTVEVSRGAHGRARLMVRDEGAGIDPATLDQALDGVRIDSDGKPIEGRRGLGLPLARQLIAGHGGKLELRSAPGQGTVAIVDLP